MTDPASVAAEEALDDGAISEGSLTPGGNRIGPKAWRLIVSLSEYDDWLGVVLEVVDEAALAARSGPASPGGLDVERLDATWKNLTQQGGHAYGYMGVSKHVWRAFAAEYARLTEEATR